MSLSANRRAIPQRPCDLQHSSATQLGRKTTDDLRKHRSRVRVRVQNQKSTNTQQTPSKETPTRQ